MFAYLAPVGGGCSGSLRRRGLDGGGVSLGVVLVDQDGSSQLLLDCPLPCGHSAKVEFNALGAEAQPRGLFYRFPQSRDLTTATEEELKRGLSFNE